MFAMNLGSNVGLGLARRRQIQLGPFQKGIFRLEGHTHRGINPLATNFVVTGFTPGSKRATEPRPLPLTLQGLNAA